MPQKVRHYLRHFLCQEKLNMIMHKLECLELVVKNITVISMFQKLRMPTDLIFKSGLVSIKYMGKLFYYQEHISPIQ